MSSFQSPPPFALSPSNTKNVINNQLIQSAIDNITDAAIDKKYSILIYPGKYPENIVMKPYINLVGVDKDSCIINPPSGTAITFNDLESNISNLSVIQNLGTLESVASLILVSSGKHSIENCYLESTKDDGNYNLSTIFQNGGSLLCKHTDIKYDVTSGTGSSILQACVNAAVGAESLILKDVNINVENSDTNDIITGFSVSDLSQVTYKIYDCEFNLINNGQGFTAGMFLYNSGSGCIVKNCEWNVHAQTTAYGGYVGSTTGATAFTMNNKIKVTAALAYSGYIAPNNTWTSVGDFIEAADGATITGTGIFYTYTLQT